MHERDAERGDFTALDSLLHCATGFTIVPAVAESAMPEQGTDLDEGIGDGLRRDMRESEYFQSGGIDDPALARVHRQRVEG